MVHLLAGVDAVREIATHLSGARNDKKGSGSERQK